MPKKRNSPVTDEQILADYQTYKSANKIADLYGIGKTTIYRVLAKNGVVADGLELWRHSAHKHTDDQSRLLRIRYEAGATVKALVDELGGSYSSVKRAIKAAGGTLRPNPIPTVKPGEADEIRALYESGLSQQRVSLAIGRSQSFVTRVMKDTDIKSRTDMDGELHPRWNGGEWQRPDGYFSVWVSYDDPLSIMRDRSGYVRKHRLVMARSLGRPLDPTETVHHIDGDKTNNSIENLQLRQGRHGKNVVMQCYDCGSQNVHGAALK